MPEGATPAVSVLLPTHDHADTLLRSVSSARTQTLPVLEILIVGDGVPDRTREIAAGLEREDPRVRFFDFEKGPGHGESHRHTVMGEARGELVLTLADDDLWLPHHVETLAALLADADLAHTLPVDVHPDGNVWSWHFDLRRVADRDLMRRWRTGFGLATGGYRLDAYRRLPEGWRPAPAGGASDLHMWNQFVEQPWCRARSSPAVTTLHFGVPRRREWTLARRCEELDAWLAETTRPGAVRRLQAQVIEGLGRSYGPLNAHLFDSPESIAVAIDERDRLRAEVAHLRTPRWRRALRRLRGRASALRRKPGERA